MRVSHGKFLISKWFSGVSSIRMTGMIFILVAVVWAVASFAIYTQRVQQLPDTAFESRDQIERHRTRWSETGSALKSQVQQAILNSQKQAHVHKFLTDMVLPLVVFAVGISIIILSRSHKQTNL